MQNSCIIGMNDRHSRQRRLGPHLVVGAWGRCIKFYSYFLARVQIFLEGRMSIRTCRMIPVYQCVDLVYAIFFSSVLAYNTAHFCQSYERIHLRNQ